MFIAGVKIWKFGVGLLIMAISYPFFWNSIKPYQQKRILSFLNPESDPLGQGYQLIQSKIALGSGSLTGKGFLEGTQSYLEYLPEKQTDFIFTLIGEEFGFIGTIFGTFIGLGLTYYLQEVGLDYTKALESLSSTNMIMPNVFYAKVTPDLFYIGFLPGVLATVLGTMLAGRAIYKREMAQLFKELET